MKDHIVNYLNCLKKDESYRQTEHTCRTFLQNLLKEFSEPKKIILIHEPKRDHKGRGAPDFCFKFQDMNLGFLENKQVGENLNKLLKSDQVTKYKTLTRNLIITDYLRWIWIYDENVVKDVRLCEETLLEKKGLIVSSDIQIEPFIELIEGFLNQKLEDITEARTLSKMLAKPTRTIRDHVKEVIQEQLQEKISSPLVSLYEEAFKKNISENITISQFADALAQTFAYSLFLAKLNLNDDSIKFSLSTVADYTPKSFSVIENILTFIPKLKQYPALLPYIDTLLNLINCTNKQRLEASLKFSKGEEADPYIYFYEDFLKEYDHKQKIESGVYYTPPAIVQCIVKNLDDILKQDFQLSEGLSDISVKALDFACGTGTFLFEIYKMILGLLDLSPEKKDLQIFEERLITKHILENIYGFEWLIPAYCVSHLKLSQYLKQKGYTLKENQRIPVYLTNTLEENRPHPSPFLEAITEETRISYSIKKEKDILIITGNPPYNVKSKNHITGNLINFHENYKPKDEKNINILSDDYIKFIAFAHHKIQQTGSGAIGIIVNNSFLSGLTHRRMRNQLRKDFEKIYILNLRGSGSVMDGIRDENVFDIQQEVCLVWFIKNPVITQKGVFYKEITGSRDQKFQQLATLNREEFQELKIDDFNQQFRLTQWGKNRFTDNLSFFYPIGKTLKPLLEYGKFWGMTEIFKQYSSGIQTARDHITIHFEKKSLREVLKKFQTLSPKEILNEFNTKDGRDWTAENAKKDTINWKEENITSIHYRPFDIRQTYYTGKTRGFLSYPRNEIMQHLLYKGNLGLVYPRICHNKEFDYSFIVKNIIDRSVGGKNSGSETYTSPLYLYPNFNANLDLEDKEKKPNFHKTFWEFVQKQFQQPSPEEILGYIYGVLYSPQYRKRYLELLKIDFPRIPFHVSLEQFQHLSALGQQLIQAHLLQKVPSLALGKPKNEGKPNYIIEKPLYKEETHRLYFNTHCYFEDVPQSIWDFKIGGYQVLYKYLNDRKGRDISEDLEHITKVINVLDFTLKTMAKIDQIPFLIN